MSAKAAELQKQVRENADDYQNYLRSLYQWEDEIKIKDEALKNSPKKPFNDQEFPIRNKQSVINNAPPKDNEPKRVSLLEEIKSSPSVQQNKQKALLEKNKGNEYFKEGKFEAAIKCYSNAIQLDTSDAVLPANRAIAFLKMNKFAEAEEDCNTSLKLDPTFVKAYHRRGTARANIGKVELAKKDFEKVLSLEPHNKAAQQELDRLVKDSRSKTSLEKDKRPTVTFKEPNVAPPKVIAIVKNVVKPEVALKHPSLITIEELNPIANTSKTEPITQIPIVAVSDTKQEELVIGKLISQFSAKEPVDAKSTASEKAVVSDKLPPVPKSYVQFDQEWKRLNSRSDLQYEYLKQIPPGKLPDIFLQSLETDVLGGIIKILKQEFISRDESIIPWLNSLLRVKRISAVLMFLSSQEKLDLQSLVTHVMERSEGSEEERQRLIATFN